MIVYIFLDSIAEYVDWAGIRAAFVTVDEIADSTKLSKGSVQAAMRRLKSMNWAKHTHGYSTINTYIVAELDVAVKKGLDMIGMEESSVR
jgi:DNA-binding transcriptional regulator GbsR (MarR family)